jgi:diguanylate cyclase (GGDEF)-like protein/PAS domain S-box-containing protein
MRTETTGKPEHSIQYLQTGVASGSLASHIKRALRVLIVEDNVDDATLIVLQLRQCGDYEVEWERVNTENEYVNRLRPRLDLILSDYSLANFSGLRALTLLKESGLDIPFILISGAVGEELAVAAMKQGAADYLLKDRLMRLAPATAQVLEQFRLRRERAKADRRIARGMARLNDAQRIGKIGDWDYNIVSGAITWSPQVFAILGRDPQLGPPRDFNEFVELYDAASQSLMRERASRAIETGEMQEQKLSGRRPDLSWFHVKNMAVPRKDARGKVLSLHGTIQDVTERTRVLASFKESRRRLALATEAAHIGIWDWDVVANKVVWDDRMYSLYGIRKRELGGALDAWRNGVHPQDRSRCDSDISAALEGVKDFHAEFRVVWPDGETRDIEAHAVVQRAADCSPTRMIGVNWDITDRKRAELRIKRLNRVYAVLSGINSLIVRAQDQSQLFGEACQIAIELGQFKIAWIGIVDQIARTITPAASAGLESMPREFIEDRVTLSEQTPLDADTATARAVRDRKAHVVNTIQGDTTMISGAAHVERGLLSMAILPLLVAGDAVGVLSLYSNEVNFFDAEEMKLLEELAGDIAFAIDHIEKQRRIDYLAYYDVLTGLANRNLFLERLNELTRSAEATGKKFALFLIDLERFRNINDSLGQAAGDSLLKQVAEWLTGDLNESSVLARVGADQFAAVLPEKALRGGAVQLVEKMMEALLAFPFRLNGVEFRIAAKVGMALFPEDGLDVDTLFKNAEAALKKAKSNGTRYLRYTHKMTEALAGKLVLESQLRQAIEREEFVLHYQPKVSLMTGELTSVEALIRWNDPRSGLVLPGQFIPLLEETGLIFEVGRWVLSKAIEDYLQWRDDGLAPVRVAINISPLQLRQHAFIAEIEQAIGVDADAASGLELEITESLVMEDIKHSVSSLQAIRAMNVRVAVDDFGTGFSSLNYLSKLPVDSLKIDRAFVTDMTCGPQGLALVSTIINLAHSFKLTAVAEGVETEEQSRLLRLLSCDEMQGYFVSRPIPGEVFAAKYLSSSVGPIRAKMGRR